MAGTMVSASTGAMNSLLGKLATLMGEEFTKLKYVRKEVASLEDEFSSMKALLDKLADMEEIDVQAKDWRNHVKDMSYGIEDCIDEFMHHLGKNDATTGFVKKTARLLKKLRARHQIASKIQEIKAHVKEVSERHLRYKLDEYTAKPSYVPVDPRVVAIYAEAAGLVGISVPREELAKLLMTGEQELKVASIVGFGGLGKTTLANQVYHKLEVQFERRAFVSVSQKPDIPKLLNKILLEIGGCFSPTSELDDLLKYITELLQDKRYFIVIDDLWDYSTWEVIRCAFPQNNCGSRVLTTTRIHSVAFACCSYRKQYVYNMRPLSEEDSRKLFFSRIFGYGEACPDEFVELSAADILKKCSGLPLAVISIASLLAGQSKMTWEYVRTSLVSMFEANSNLEYMKQVLDLSYRNLPHHLKTCLLYLGMYPEDYIIQKNDLLRQWIAEGFVSKIHGLDMEKVAESYFNELLNMSLIQPWETNCNNEVLTCRVHDIMLDLIRVKSAEESFIDIIDTREALSALHRKVRRISLHEVDGVALSTVSEPLSQVRSVMAFASVYPSLFQGFKYVRVLVLEFWITLSAFMEKVDISGVCGLFLLRYLKIVSNTDMELPNRIWSLQYLETVDLQLPPGLLTIPSAIVRLCRLLHLIVPRHTGFQGRISSLISLRTLQGFSLSTSSLDSIKHLGKLINLRYLSLEYCELISKHPPEMVLNALRASLEELAHSSSLKSLVLRCGADPYVNFDGWSTSFQFPCHLQKLHLEDCLFTRVPKWIAELRSLYSLKLMIREVGPSDGSIGILSGLPSLVHLHLTIEGCPEARISIPSTGVAFPALKHLEFRCVQSFPGFEVGATPRLQRLDVWLSVEDWGQDIDNINSVGIEQLPASIREIHVDELDSYDSDTRECYVVAESTLRSMVNALHPDVTLIFDWIW